jgi:hypothetical protein
VLAAALLPRLALWAHRRGPLWLEEDIPHQLALSLWGFQSGRFDLDPHYALWPHFSVYFFLVPQVALFLWGRATGSLSGPADFRAMALMEPEVLRGAAMLLAVAVSVALVALAYRLARDVAGRGAAVGVALILALDPIHLRHSLAISPDMPMAMFVLLGLITARRIERKGAPRDSVRAGLWTGFATACKYAAAILVLPLAVAHHRRPRGKKEQRSWLDPRLGTCVLAAAAAFVATSPFTLLDWSRESEKLGLGVGAVTGGHFGNARLPSVAAYALEVLPDDLGWPLWLLVASGLLWVTLRRRSPHLVALAFLLPYAALFGFLPTVFPRYVLPALPVALAVAAAAVLEGWERPRFRPVLALWLAAAAIGLAFQSVRFFATYSRDDTRTLARAWLTGHARDRDLVSSEHLGPELPNRLAYDLAAASPGISPARAERLRRGPAYWVGTIPLTLERPESTTPHYDLRLFHGLDWVIVNDGVRARFEADTLRFPVQHALYRALERDFEHAWTSPPHGVSGPTVRIYGKPRLPLADVDSAWAPLLLAHPELVAEWPSEKLVQIYSARAAIKEAAGRGSEAVELRALADRMARPAGR